MKIDEFRNKTIKEIAEVKKFLENGTLHKMFTVFLNKNGLRVKILTK